MLRQESTTEATTRATPGPRNLLSEADLHDVLAFDPFEGDKGAPLDLSRETGIVSARFCQVCLLEQGRWLLGIVSS